MSQKFALLICILLIFLLFWLDRKSSKGLSKSIWITFSWLLFTQTRSITALFGSGTTAAAAGAEGSPLNKTIYIFLIILGIIVLLKRTVDWHMVLTKNRAICLFFLFGMLSIFWSDYPVISLTRWIKGLGVLIMVLIVATDTRPNVAMGTILKRLAFITLPLSALFIKYYPDLGRVYHMGKPMYTGIFMAKNSLGALCMFTGIYFFWHFIMSRKDQKEKISTLPFSILLIIIPIIIWLLYMANSATSYMCIIVAVCLFMLARLPMFSRAPHKLMVFIFTGIPFYIFMEWVLGIKDIIITMLGREPDLTGRSAIWEKYLSMVENPLLGYGYEIFYTSAILQNKMPTEYYAAHNGYLEMYLNLGIIGVFLVIWIIVTGLVRLWQFLVIDYEAAVFKLSLIIVVTLYACTETAFSGLSTLWMLLLFACISVPPNKIGSTG